MALHMQLLKLKPLLRSCPSRPLIPSFIAVDESTEAVSLRRIHKRCSYLTLVSSIGLHVVQNGRCLYYLHHIPHAKPKKVHTVSFLLDGFAPLKERTTKERSESPLGTYCWHSPVPAEAYYVFEKMALYVLSSIVHLALCCSSLWSSSFICSPFIHGMAIAPSADVSQGAPLPIVPSPSTAILPSEPQLSASQVAIHSLPLPEYLVPHIRLPFYSTEYCCTTIQANN